VKRFSFNLEKVLELRKYREQETKIELGRAIAVLTEIEGRIRKNAESRSLAAGQRFSLTNQAPDILSWDNYIIRLDQEAERLMAGAAKAELVVEEKQEIFLAASRDRKVIDKLKEKREKEYRDDFFTEENRERDDIASGVRARVLLNGLTVD
jgi:flagellar FliJ protein